MTQANLSIKLTPAEAALFGVLQKVADDHGLVLRAAGGWVRDKLLNRPCSDIDIAIDKATGAEFAGFLQKSLGVTPHVIAANPEQSKHLETATVRIGDFDIDLVNLRDESFGKAYEGGRILSENRFGSPKIDAERRDLTINSLFFNLNTLEVEDFVCGLLDLESPIVLRTPLPSVKTFLDDPLRILRAFRFMSRFEGSKIGEEEILAMRREDVQEALMNRVSSERFGLELFGKYESDGTFKCGLFGQPFCVEALTVMEECGILKCLLSLDELKRFSKFRMDQNNPHHKYDVFEHTMKVMSNLRDHEFFKSLSSKGRMLLMVSAFLHDFGKLDPECQQKHEDRTSYKGHEDSSEVVAKVLLSHWARGQEESDFVCQVVGGHMRPHGGLDSPKALRKFRHLFPDSWEHIVVLSECDVHGSGTARPASEFEKYSQMVIRGKDQIEAELNAPPTCRPLVGGHRIMEMIPELAPSTGFIKVIQEKLLELRLENPDSTSADYEDVVLEMKPGLIDDFSE